MNKASPAPKEVCYMTDCANYRAMNAGARDAPIDVLECVSPVYRRLLKSGTPYSAGLLATAASFVSD